MIELIISFWSEHFLGRLHFILAMLSLIIGPLVFLNEKGTVFHRTLGLIYVLSMMTVNVSALMMYKIAEGPNLFHAFAIISIGTIIPGMIAIRRGLVIAHYHFMSWSYFGLLAAFISQVATQIGATASLSRLTGGLDLYSIVAIITLILGIFASVMINMHTKSMIDRYAGLPERADSGQ